MKTRDALADRHLRAYQATLRGGVEPDDRGDGGAGAAREGALAWRADHPEAWYRLGVHRTEFADSGGGARGVADGARRRTPA